jgi:site-specific DNA-methyltransferase (cytosine-N4-specific)
MQYYWNQDAVREPLKPDSLPRIQRGRSDNHKWSNGGPGNQTIAKDLTKSSDPNGRNIRSVWNIATQPYPGPHFATFPEKIPETCIKAGSRIGDTILDPFCGSGTTCFVAERLSRRWIGIDADCSIAMDRIGEQTKQMRLL